jgi:hypothetical protein
VKRVSERLKTLRLWNVDWDQSQGVGAVTLLFLLASIQPKTRLTSSARLYPRGHSHPLVVNCRFAINSTRMSLFARGFLDFDARAVLVRSRASLVFSEALKLEESFFQGHAVGALSEMIQEFPVLGESSPPQRRYVPSVGRAHYCVQQTSSSRVYQ